MWQIVAGDDAEIEKKQPTRLAIGLFCLCVVHLLV